MRIAILAGILAAAASVGSASSLLVGNDNDGNGSFLVGNQASLNYDSGTGEISAGYANIGWAQSFTLLESVLASDIRVWAQYDNVPATYELQLTNQIGAGTTSANVLFDTTASFSDTYSWMDFNLGNMVLGPGTYYVVMTSGTPVPEPALDGSDCREGAPSETQPQTGCYVAGNWGFNGTNLSNTTIGNIGDLFIAIGGFGAHDAPGRLLTDFDPNGTPNGAATTFQLNGTLAATATPEPGTMVLLAGAGLLMAFTKRRLVRNR
ncbi:MAG TPA: PEP-CTERM sorting domain-containing protein [Verrucomicrobiae bacterium]|nr:PEP-CTERM sorting domain-containing protein [Verrucomicrobiae bacterium]